MICAIVAAIMIVSLWIDEIVRTTVRMQAERSATLWTDRIEQDLPALEALLAGATPTERQLGFISASMVGSDVFEIQFFDRNGIEVFDSNPADRWQPGEHYASAETVARTGEFQLDVKTGNPALGQPSRYVEAYLPLYLGQDQPVGVVELYIDASAPARGWLRGFSWYTAAIVILTLLVLLAPSWAVWRQHLRLRDSETEFRRLSYTDPLTGLLNRRGIRVDLSALSAKLGDGSTVGLLHIDLDNFKPINDAFDHHLGDKVLVALADRLHETVGPDGIVGRAGGDEFLVCRVFGPDHQSACTAFAETIRARLSTPVWIEGQSYQLGASIGVAHWSGGGEEGLAEALQNADMALHTAKTVGRNTVLAFTPDMRQRRKKDALLLADASRGLQSGEFTAHFQPVLDVKTGRVSGFEALLRWQHPQRGLLAPDEFLPLCRAAGLSDALNRALYTEAAAFIRCLRHAGLDTLTISLNLAAPELKAPGTAEALTQVLAAHGADPASFRLEVVESTLIEDRSITIIENLKALHASGFVLDLDDFGTGHTAIGNLHRLPISRIKIDQSLIRGIDHDPIQKIMAKAVIDLAHNLSLEVVGEGVETAAELTLLETLACDGVQGYLLGKPAPAAECLDTLRRDGYAWPVAVAHLSTTPFRATKPEGPAR